MPRWEDESFYEVEVAVEETRRGIVSVWVRAADEVTARQLAVERVTKACDENDVGDNAFEEVLDGSEATCSGIESCKVIAQGAEPEYEAPHFDLLNEPTTVQDAGMGSLLDF